MLQNVQRENLSFAVSFQVKAFVSQTPESVILKPRKSHFSPPHSFSFLTSICYPSTWLIKISSVTEKDILNFTDTATLKSGLLEKNSTIQSIIEFHLFSIYL